MKHYYLLIIACLLTFNSFAISGPSTVCVGSNITLTDGTPGGTWSSSNVLLAAITTYSGLVTGMGGGYVTITYTVGSSYTTFALTVNPTPPPISGTTIVCTGANTTLIDPVPGTWSSGSPGIASIDPSTGVLMGVSAGTAHIDYTNAFGCSVGINVTVNPSPLPVGGATAVCQGDTLHLSDSTTGGTWTSSSPAIAGVGSYTGVVTSVSAGVVSIVYTISNGCIASKTVTVHPFAAITGLPGLCVGDTIALADTVPGGTWSSSATTVASVTGTGLVTGLTAGTTTISYLLPTGCLATRVISVYPLPVAISGLPEVCVGTTTMLSDSTTPGTFSSAGVYTSVSSGGIVTGIAGGTEIVTYTEVTHGCKAAVMVTVNTTPGPVSGSLSMCQGAGTTLSGAPGGSWVSADTSVARVTFSTGIVTGIAAGTDTISYSFSAGCVSTVVVTVNPLPSAIIGPHTVCPGASVTLSDTTAGGGWYSSDTSVVHIDSASGMAVGVGAGAATILYILPTGCIASIPFHIYNPDIPQLCVTTYDTLTGRNKIVWEKFTLHRASFFQVYRKNSSGTWITVGTIPGTAFSTFTDTLSFPLLQSYSYRITLTDSCNQESDIDSSVIHTTIHLSGVVDTGDVILTWNKYVGKTITMQTITRSLDGGPFDSVGTVSSAATTFTDHAPPAGSLRYMIAATTTGGCTPTARTTAYEAVWSNPVSLTMDRTGINELTNRQVTVYPNPTTGDIFISGITGPIVEVYNAIGQRLISASLSANHNQLSLSALPSGQYIVKVYDDAGRLVKMERVTKH